MAVQTSKDVDIENATYDEWLSEHFVSSVLMYSPKGVLQTSENIFKTKFVVLGPIIAANINVVGWHDSHIVQSIYHKGHTRWILCCFRHSISLWYPKYSWLDTGSCQDRTVYTGDC